VFIFVEEGYDLNVVYNEVRVKVNVINTFPKNQERPQIQRLKGEQPILRIVITGAENEKIAKEITRKVRDQLAAVNGVNRVALGGIRNL